MTLSINRFRFHGIRKLNWAERAWNADYNEHVRSHGFEEWIEPGPVSIVVGPNGGGKSTLIDLLRSLADAKVWPTLPRENYPGDDFVGFDIEGSRFRLSARVSKHTPRADQMFELSTLLVAGARDGVERGERVLLPKYRQTGDWERQIQAVLDAVVRLRVEVLAVSGELPASGISDGELAELLNELSGHFPSVLANPQVRPFRIFQGAAAGDGRIGILFKDDPSQHAFVHRDMLPLGWLQLASVLGFLRRCQSRSLILLDEPDLHLHPSLQRVMLDLVAAERARLDAQVVIASHSSVLCNPELAAAVGAKVLVAARGRLAELSDSRGVLDDLGVTSGDLVQANGIIWVEGPSDRIYIKTWLERYAQMLRLPAPVERVHYALASYGGALLKHLTVGDDGPERVGLAAINRNWAIVVDRDLPQSASGELQREKQRILDEAKAAERSGHVWLTEDYTMECYLPKRFDRWVRRHDTGRVSVEGMTKVELAERFRYETPDWANSYRPGSDLPARIAQLFSILQEWQTPQEIIRPPFLPPFLRSEDQAAALVGP